MIEWIFLPNRDPSFSLLYASAKNCQMNSLKQTINLKENQFTTKDLVGNGIGRCTKNWLSKILFKLN
jgi:hypothetical protein